ncbi:hypothetical protein AB0L06_35180 [Spirillospora sp. NPDC052269]
MRDIEHQTRPASSSGSVAAENGLVGVIVHAVFLVVLCAPFLLFVGNFSDEPLSPEALHAAHWCDVAALGCVVVAALLAGIAVMVGLRLRLGYWAALIIEIVLGSVGIAATLLYSATVVVAPLSTVISCAVCVCFYFPLTHSRRHR